MAHPAQQAFCREVKQRFPEFFRGQRVLEIGARFVNGTLRDLFQECRYLGIDVVPGEGVDVVCLGHELQAEPASFDVVCSAETFEHDPYAEQTVQHMVYLLRSGGLFFMTCAGEGRPEHGTVRTGKRYGPDANYYRNVGMDTFLSWLTLDSHRFDELYLRHDAEGGDLYFFGIKA